MLMRSPLARERRLPAGFIKPCQPTLSEHAPTGPLWVHEIKHDDYHIIASKRGEQVRLWSRNGRDWSRHFSAIAEALQAVEADELVIDGEACAHCPDGLPDFHGLRSDSGSASVSVRFRPSPGGRARPPANALGGAPGALADAVLASCRAPRGRRGGNLPHACAL